MNALHNFRLRIDALLAAGETTFGQLARDARRSKKFDLASVTSNLDCSESYLSKVERSIERPNKEFALRMTSVLGLDKDTITKLGHVPDDIEELVLRNPKAARAVLKAAHKRGEL